MGARASSLLVLALTACGGAATPAPTTNAGASVLPGAEDATVADAPEPLEQSEMRAHLRRLEVDARGYGDILLPSEPVARWAESVAGSADGPHARARAIHAWIRGQAERGRIEDWSFGVPLRSPVAQPVGALERLTGDATPGRFYPLELAALAVAGLRALGVRAMVADAAGFLGDSSPPDPSGQLGYFVVAVFDGDEREPSYHDPYGGRVEAPEGARVLDDPAVVAAALSIEALRLLTHESDAAEAMALTNDALRLDDGAPSAHAVRGAVSVASGDREEALWALEEARRLRPDAPRHNLVALLRFAEGDIDAASRGVAAALAQYPEFARAHATLAAIHLSGGDTEAARAALERAQRSDPDLHLLPELWASYHLAVGETERAVEHAQRAVERNPDSSGTRLNAARMYRLAGRYDLMRREAHAVLERTPPDHRSQMREQIVRMLGPSALDPPDE